MASTVIEKGKQKKGQKNKQEMEKGKEQKPKKWLVIVLVILCAALSFIAVSLYRQYQDADNQVSVLQDELSRVYAQSEVTPTPNVAGDSVPFGKYIQDEADDPHNPPPIMWKILKVDADGDMLLLANNCLDVRGWGKQWDNWKSSDLRTWLNTGKTVGSGENGFLDAFDENELKHLLFAYNKEQQTGFESVDRNDRVFVLTEKEIAYFFNDRDSRSAKPTDYAEGQGPEWDPDNTGCWWWTRTLDTDGIPKYVGGSGVISSNLKTLKGGNYHDPVIKVAVRPAIWVKAGTFPPPSSSPSPTTSPESGSWIEEIKEESGTLDILTFFLCSIPGTILTATSMYINYLIYRLTADRTSSVNNGIGSREGFSSQNDIFDYLGQPKNVWEFIFRVLQSSVHLGKFKANEPKGEKQIMPQKQAPNSLTSVGKNTTLKSATPEIAAPSQNGNSTSNFEQSFINDDKPSKPIVPKKKKERTLVSFVKGVRQTLQEMYNEARHK